MLYTYSDGIVLRTTYHVFDMYVKHTMPVVLDSQIENAEFTVGETRVTALDAVATLSDDQKTLSVCIINKSPSKTLELELQIPWISLRRKARLIRLSGDSPDAFNSVEHPNRVTPDTRNLDNMKQTSTITVSPHSVNILELSTT
jgi:alpha-N-arabinofuranosidase